MSLSTLPDRPSSQRRDQLVTGLLAAIPLALVLGFALPHVSPVTQFVGAVSGSIVAAGTVGYALFGIPVSDSR